MSLLVFDVRVLAQQLPGHEGDVVGAGPVPVRFGAVVQTGAVDEMGVLHAQLLCPLVHPVHKGPLAAG